MQKCRFNTQIKTQHKDPLTFFFFVMYNGSIAGYNASKY